MIEVLEKLARKIEVAEPSSHCFTDKLNCQIIISFDNRPDVEVALLTPYAQQQVKNGYLDADLYSEILFSVKKIANWRVA